jgi:hypothetical protein
MTTHPERPNPPTRGPDRLRTADAERDHSDTWVGRTRHDEVPNDPVVVLFTEGEITPTGKRR